MLKKGVAVFLAAVMVVISTPANMLAETMEFAENFDEQLPADDSGEEVLFGEDSADEEFIDEIILDDEDMEIREFSNEGADEFAEDVEDGLEEAPDLASDLPEAEEILLDDGEDVMTETVEVLAEKASETVSMEALADSDELFAGYVDKLFYGSKTGLSGNKRKAVRNYNQLSGNDLIVYNALYSAISAIASGEEPPQL